MSGAVSWLTTVMAACLAAGIANAQPTQGDLRSFRIGMPVNELPTTGYVGFACAAAPHHALAGWAEYAECPKGEDGFHAVAFRYGRASDPEAALGEDYRGTKVAGHPALVALLIDDHGIVQGIRIATDPDVPLYLHKKAFLFAGQVKARYGEQGWHCTEMAPQPGQSPIGDEFINRSCEKTTATRRYVLTQQLFARTGQPLRDFVSAAEVTILAAPSK